MCAVVMGALLLLAFAQLFVAAAYLIAGVLTLSLKNIGIAAAAALLSLWCFDAFLHPPQSCPHAAAAIASE